MFLTLFSFNLPIYLQAHFLKTYKLTSTEKAIAEEDTPRTSTSSSLPEGIVPLVDLGDGSEDDDRFATPPQLHLDLPHQLQLPNLLTLLNFFL